MRLSGAEPKITGGVSEMVATEVPNPGLCSKVNTLEHERIPNLEHIVREIAKQYGARLAELERTVGVAVQKPIEMEEP
jgi:hypothetical protein